METETKGKDQGPTKEEQLAKPPEAPESIKGPKGPEHSRKHSSPSGISIGEPHFSLGLAPHLQNTMWQPEGSNSKVIGNGDDSLWMTTLIVSPQY